MLAVLSPKQIRADRFRTDAMLHQACLLRREQQRTHPDLAQTVLLPYGLHHPNPRVCVRTQEQMTQFVGRYRAQQTPGVNAPGDALDSIEEHIAIPALAI